MTPAEYKAKCAIAFQAARLALEVADRDPVAAAAIMAGAARAIRIEPFQVPPDRPKHDPADALDDLAAALKSLPYWADALARTNGGP